MKHDRTTEPTDTTSMRRWGGWVAMPIRSDLGMVYYHLEGQDIQRSMVEWEWTQLPFYQPEQSEAAFQSGMRHAAEITLKCPDGTCPVDVFRAIQAEVSR